MRNFLNLDFLSLNSEAFGLDISDLSFKIAKLRNEKGSFVLTSYIEQEIQSGIVEDGEIKNENLLAKAIKKAVKEVKGEKLKTKYAIVSLPEEKAFVQVIQMPQMNREELQKSVRFEAENYIPLPFSESCLDFQIVQPLYNHLDHTDVLISAFPRVIADKYVQAVKKAGLVPLVFEVESQAVSRAIVKNKVSPFPILLIDFGAVKSGFIIFSGHSLRFTSSIPVSSSKFTAAIAKNLNVSTEEAERLKKEYGLTRKSKEGEAVFESLIPALTDLMEQVKIHIRYYQTHSFHEHLALADHTVKKILICGGGANLKGLTDFISKELFLPVEIGNPWVNILGETPKEIPELPYEESLAYTTALGLALRGARTSRENKDHA
ncbi:MAG: type IV pilus assembly protein PilM [bacterium]